MLYPTLKLVISMQDELLLRDITDPTKLNSVLLRAINTARRGLEQAADLLRRQYADLDKPPPQRPTKEEIGAEFGPDHTRPTGQRREPHPHQPSHRADANKLSS